jgi:peptidoglycan/xylan/chitin deacetylase (PgdA/CDA1 family)
MFHHFHDSFIHTKSQGSITKDDLYKMINFIGKNNILDAEVFFEKLKNKKLKKNQVCLTFDDGIKSQIDIALPVLEELRIKSFFFVYSSMFEGKPDNLEVFRYFRMNYFSDVDEFYKNFYEVLDKDLQNFFEINKDKIKKTKFKFPVYSLSDIKFRFVRDYFLRKDQYEEIMFLMFKEKKFNYKDSFKKLFFDNNDLLNLNSLGHVIGLHSHSHPTFFENLDYDQQKKEYEKCISLISNLLDKPKNEIKSMSYPCGSYNKDTLNILKDLGIELGFKETMKIDTERGMKKVNNSILEIAREDHANIFNRMIK